MSSRGRWRTTGYVASNKDKGTFTIMIATGETKKYYVADLGEVLEVVTGNRSYARVLRPS